MATTPSFNFAFNIHTFFTLLGLAQLGLFGFLCEATIPGSVPALSGVVQPYSGEVMAPFTTNVIGQPFGL